MQSFRELRVWQAAIELVTACYRLTRGFPDAERFGLISQIQRAAVSIPANIAEGHGRGTAKAFRSFLWIANGSLTELETHLVSPFASGMRRTPKSNYCWPKFTPSAACSPPFAAR